MNEYVTNTGLEKAANQIGKTSLLSLFEQEPDRVERMGGYVAQIKFDFSRQKLDKNALACLLEFAKQRDVESFLTRMHNGEIVSPSEGRAAQHMALRATKGAALFAQGTPISKKIDQTRQRMQQLGEDIRSAKVTGADGQRITHIVHIGIGGSDLGPKLVANALHQTAEPGIKLRFAANVDAAEINDALEGLNPATTLIFVVSKSFSTIETLANATVARSWLRQHLGDAAVGQQIFAISANPNRAAEFGINPDHVFGFADWVGGRFSLWSAVGLSLVVGLGHRCWDQLLAGAAEMDQHVLSADFEQNMPVLSALISFWNLNYLGMPGRAIVPYAARMALLPVWMKQLVMESNGKSVQTDDTPVQYCASPIIFGDAGSNAQHAFFQALHQAPTPVPVDFIGVRQDQEHNLGQHRVLLANMVGQASALMRGKQNLQDPQKNFPGDRPSTTILLDELSPFALGALLAFYEHETVILAHLCGINPFDQWGVELGKQLAGEMEGRLAGRSEPVFDAATEAMLSAILEG